MVDSSDMEKTAEMPENPSIKALFDVGAHFAYARARRHPTAVPYLFGAKNRVEIFDLGETHKKLEEAKNYVSALAATGKQILFVASKFEARDALRQGAESIGMPYVAGRFIGGTITNFPQIRKRVEKLERLLSERESGELAKYTKKERLLIDREIDKLSLMFGGIVPMKSLPAALFVIDPKREHIAVAEARYAGIPVIALANSDCNLKEVTYPIPANDSAKASITHVVTDIVAAYRRAPEVQ